MVKEETELYRKKQTEINGLFTPLKVNNKTKKSNFDVMLKFDFFL